MLGLGAWNRACSLAIRTCEALADCREAAVRDSLTRLCLALPATIAAGCECESRGHFARHLRESRAHCAALRTQLYIAAQLDQLPLACSTELMQETVELGRLLAGLTHWCEGDGERLGLRPRHAPRATGDLQERPDPG